MPSFSKFLIAGLAAQSSGLVLTGPAISSKMAVRGGPLSMQESPQKQNFDNDMSGWKPPTGAGGAHALGGDASLFEGTDTGDFAPEEGSRQDALAKGISYTDGLKGSQADPNRKKSTGPELAGALDSDPDIYVPEILEVEVDTSDFVLPEPTFRVEKMEVSATHQDFTIDCASTMDKQLVIEVKPICMTFEDFYCGFTADSHPAFSVKPAKGTMERRNGPPTELTVTVDPSGASGELVGYLCVILPDEKDFSQYYKITCNAI